EHGGRIDWMNPRLPRIAQLLRLRRPGEFDQPAITLGTLSIGIGNPQHDWSAVEDFPNKPVASRIGLLANRLFVGVLNCRRLFAVQMKYEPHASEERHRILQ